MLYDVLAKLRRRHLSFGWHVDARRVFGVVFLHGRGFWQAGFVVAVLAGVSLALNGTPVFIWVHGQRPLVE